MTDNVNLIKDGKEVIGFRVNGKEFYAEEEGRIETLKEELDGFNISSIPKGFYFEPITEEDGYVRFEGGISSSRKYAGIASMNNHIYRKYWDHKFGALQYVDAMKRAIEIRSKTNKDVKFSEIEDDGAHIFIRYEIVLKEDMPIDKAYEKFQETVKEIEGHTERLLEGEEISKDILKDEPTFTVEVLLPLFRNMGFIDVKYNHSKREFGKDVTFSEIDKFKVRRNYGVQVKVGDLSGEAGADIDKIIAQIDDAFKMPYIDTTSREKRYISDLIIAVSGRFTNNAEDKIIEKPCQQNIYFLGIDKIQELLTEHMKKRIN